MHFKCHTVSYLLISFVINIFVSAINEHQDQFVKCLKNIYVSGLHQSTVVSL